MDTKSSHTQGACVGSTMRTSVVVVLVGLCAIALAESQYKVADKEFVGKQRDVLRLFEYVNQPAYYKDFVDIANGYKLEEHYDSFAKPEYAREFYHYYKYDHLPKGEIFSVFNQDHLKQAVALIKTLYYAKNYDIFYKTAVWARQYVNEGLFVYSLSVAVVHSKFTDGIVLPPIYEIFPQYFFNDEVIYKAQQYKQHYFTYEHENEVRDPKYKGYVIPANYSGYYLNLHPEQSMGYFTEDVGLNAYYYYMNIFYPYFLESELIDEQSQRTPNVKGSRGEGFYYFHKQILSRYYLERLSNDKGEIPHFEYEYPIETGYYPSLTYMNGLKFPTRPNHASLYYQGVHGQQSYPAFGNYSSSYTYVKDYERRLRDAIDMGFVHTPEGKVVNLYSKDGFDTLGNLIESNPESPNNRFYGNLQVFARRLLGYSYYPLDEYKLAPSALEHFETCLRDPMFYQMYKRILSFFHQYQNHQGPYQKKELLFQDVHVEDIEIDRLITYFDYFYSDIANAVYVDEKEFVEDSFEVRARQYRLNHKPFNYKVKVNSKKDTEAFVKVFIGPKYDEYGRELSMEDNYLNFFELDRFHYKLNAGQNVIERNSHEFNYYSYDPTSYKELYNQVMTAYNGGEAFKYYPDYKYYSLPQRLMLPKGKVGGQTFQIYVIVSEYHAPSNSNELQQYLVDASYNIGYPFDRPVELEEDFFVQNSLAKDVVIYHKENEVNTRFGRN